jgi:hypothetical protein
MSLPKIVKLIIFKHSSNLYVKKPCHAGLLCLCEYYVNKPYICCLLINTEMEKTLVKNPSGVHLLGNIIKNAIKLNHTVSGIRKKPTAAKLQEKTLLNLLQKAQYTRFARARLQ